MFNYAFTNKHIVASPDTVALLVIKETLFYVILGAFYNLFFAERSERSRRW